ncbi:hypothetical protein [uncultured Pedobacter sp.]|uniref:hypothetical protein n=1 Tax=uncultured Pedobacter sp. TaxID=246139 RepID=UPI0025DE6211|nr:hypothetical protein [uncultured Pedobacter sp.]
MNRLAIVVIGLMLCSACGERAGNSEQKDRQAAENIGADQDEHGCIGSAGYTWSKLKNDCIQIFNAGFRLNPVAIQKDKEVTSAFVLMSDDQSRIELFLPDDDQHSILLNKSGDLIYGNDSCRYDAKKSVLYLKDQVAYKGNVE